MPKESVLKYAAFLGLFIFVLNLLANIFYWYYTLIWFDLLMHFLGGAFVVGLAFYFAKVPLNFGTALVIVLAVGLSWEIFEAGLDKFTGTDMQNAADSLGDLVADLAGGVGAFLFFKNRRRINAV